MSGQEDLQAFRIDPLAMGSIGGGPMLAPSAPPPPGGQGGKQQPAQSTGYLTFEAVLDDKAKFDALVATIESTMKKLDEVATKGSAAEKSDARKALMAFEHATELLKLGMEEVARIKKQRAEQAKARAEKAMGKK